MKIESVSVSKFKCFVEETSFVLGENVSLFIGKNNVGKTAALDALRFLFEERLPVKRKVPSVVTLTVDLDESIINAAFSKSSFELSVSRYNQENSIYAKYGEPLLGWPFSFKVERNREGRAVGKYAAGQNIFESLEAPRSLYNYDAWSTMANYAARALPHYKIIKIAAERNILPEERDEKREIDVDESGAGLTAAIDSILNDLGKDSTLVEKELLLKVNEILKGESHFERILTLQSGKNTKHVCFLENDHRIELSEMGSGIKTIIFVVFALLYFTHGNAMFMFEEVENNLHPETQRRLFDFIYRFSVEKKVKVLLTSHSNVAINYFYGKPDCVINHIYKDGGTSRNRVIKSTDAEREALSDLGVRASDMMQANGIIWVEGPSDRLYVKRWLELKDPSLVENEHYVFEYYGGRLLSHYEGEANELTDRISLFKINNNSALIMDSDIREAGKDISKTKQRIKNELEHANSFVWVTEGKEIENYLLLDDLAKVYEDKCPDHQVGKDEFFPDYIAKADKNFASSKVEFARKITPLFTEESLQVLDLNQQIGSLAKMIRHWNGLDEQKKEQGQ